MTPDERSGTHDLLAAVAEAAVFRDLRQMPPAAAALVVGGLPDFYAFGSSLLMDDRGDEDLGQIHVAEISEDASQIGHSNFGF